MTTDHQARPLPGCPARRGDGADVSVADFFLVVHDCPGGPGARPSATEVFGFFGLPDPAHENDVVVTASVVVPSGSPAARLAHQVSNDPPGTQRAGDLLRRHVTGCPCTAPVECPALDQAMLLAALNHAAGAPAMTPPSRAPAPGPAAARTPANQAPGTMRLPDPMGGTADQVNLVLLQIAYPQFWFWQNAHGGAAPPALGSGPQEQRRPRPVRSGDR